MENLPSFGALRAAAERDLNGSSQRLERGEALVPLPDRKMIDAFTTVLKAPVLNLRVVEFDQLPSPATSLDAFQNDELATRAAAENLRGVDASEPEDLVSMERDAQRNLSGFLGTLKPIRHL